MNAKPEHSGETQPCGMSLNAAEAKALALRLASRWACHAGDPAREDVPMLSPEAFALLGTALVGLGHELAGRSAAFDRKSGIDSEDLLDRAAEDCMLRCPECGGTTHNGCGAAWHDRAGL